MKHNVTTSEDKIHPTCLFAGIKTSIVKIKLQYVK